MSARNVDCVHRLYAASRRRDKEACVREAADDVEIVSYLMGVEGTVYRGHAGLRLYIDDLFSAFPDWHPTVLQTTEYGDRVLAEVRMIGFHGFGTPAEAFEAIGVPEPS